MSEDFSTIILKENKISRYLSIFSFAKNPMKDSLQVVKSFLMKYFSNMRIECLIV